MYPSFTKFKNGNESHKIVSPKAMISVMILNNNYRLLATESPNLIAHASDAQLSVPATEKEFTTAFKNAVEAINSTNSLSGN